MSVGPTVGVGAIVLDAAGRLLVVQRGRGPATGRWSVPGGRVEVGEPLAEAVAREVAEETGLDVRVGAFVGWLERLGDEGHYVILDFRAEVIGGDLAAADDAADVRWVTRAELEQLPTTEGLLAFLDDHGVALAP